MWGKGVGVEEAMDICCETTVVRMHCGCCATNDDRIIMQWRHGNPGLLIAYDDSIMYNQNVSRNNIKKLVWKEKVCIYKIIIIKY